MRYSLLKHYYTLFVKNDGYGTIFRPLFFEFYQDENLMKDNIIDTEILLGNELLIAPILLNNKTNRQVYFPNNSFWFDY